MSYEIVESKSEISKIVTDSFLDILIEAKNYNDKEVFNIDKYRVNKRMFNAPIINCICLDND